MNCVGFRPSSHSLPHAPPVQNSSLILSSHEADFTTQFLYRNPQPLCGLKACFSPPLLLPLRDGHIFLHDFAPRNWSLLFPRFAPFVLTLKLVHLLTLPELPAGPILLCWLLSAIQSTVLSLPPVSHHTASRTVDTVARGSRPELTAFNSKAQES